jgi:hypothetical protein
MATPFEMHTSVTMIPGEDMVSDAHDGYMLSARGALKMVLCTSRAELSTEKAWVRLEKFQQHVAGLLAGQAAMTGKVNLDGLLDTRFVPRIRAAARQRGDDGFMAALEAVIDEAIVS